MKHKSLATLKKEANKGNIESVITMFDYALTDDDLLFILMVKNLPAHLSEKAWERLKVLRANNKKSE